MVCVKKPVETSANMMETADLSGFEAVNRDRFKWPDQVMVFDFSNGGTVTFSRGCLEAMGDPEYILPLISPEQKKFVLARAERVHGRDRKLHPYRVKKDESGGLVFHACALFLSKAAAFCGIPCGNDSRVLFAGLPFDGDKVMFDLTEAVVFTSGAADDLAGHILAGMAEEE